MTSPETAPFDYDPSQHNSSQDYLPPPSNQLQCSSGLEQNSASHDGVPVPAVDCPVKTKSATCQDTPLDDIFSDFVPFDAATNVKTPWQAESDSDDAFIQEQIAELIQVLVEACAWNIALAKFTTQKGGERLGSQLSEIIATEKQQGMSGSLAPSEPTGLRMASRVCTDIFVEMRVRLKDFMAKMKVAIDALRGL